MPHRLEGGALIALLESMRLSDPGHQHDRERNNVFFAEAKEVLRPRQRAFQQTMISHEMSFASRFDFEPIVLDHCLDGQPIRLIWQVRLESSEIAP